MAWVEPKTDRGDSGTRTTATDMNRIAGNINFLRGTTIKSDWTDADIVDSASWSAIINITNLMASEIETEHCTSSTDFANLNRIEQIAYAYKHYNPLVPRDNLYPSETLLP